MIEINLRLFGIIKKIKQGKGLVKEFLFIYEEIIFN